MPLGDGRRTKVLLIEDNPGDALLLEDLLTEAGDKSFLFEKVERLGTGLDRLAYGGIDLILLDLTLPDSQGLDTFHRVQARAGSIPVVVMSGLSDEKLAVQAVHEGAQDYLVKGQVTGHGLARALRYAIERKQAKAALEQTAKLAALGQLAAGLAHEINNPLTFVLNNMKVLERDIQALHKLVKLYQEAEELLAKEKSDLHRRIRDFADAIDLPYTVGNLKVLLARSGEGLKRIRQIILHLQDFARLEATDAPRPLVDLNAGIRTTLDMLRGKAQSRNVAVELDLADLPSLTCHPAKINQVILCLATNAIDACGSGGKVTVRTRSGQEGVEVHILDNGPGIDPLFQERIFNPFFTTKPPGRGLGLGLSISYRIIADHGGRIEVISSPGQGAHFTVFLPCKS